MTPLQALLFDLDGVLVDSEDAWRVLLADAVERFGGRPFTDEEFRRVFGQSVADDCALFLPGTSPAELDAFYVAEFPRRARLVRKLEGAAEVLDVCSARGLRLGCVTNAPSSIAREILAGARLLDAFEVVLAADEVPRAKPAPDLPLAALRALAVPPAAAALVGDSRFDVEAARAAGVLAIGVGSGADGADLRIESLLDLPSLVDRLRAGGR